MIRHNYGFLLISAAGMALLTGSALAQDAADTPRVAQADNLELEELVVTGRAGAGQVSKFESTVSISTFGQEALRQKAPINVADLYQVIPGLFAEPSGGEGGNNVFVRGITQPGSFRFVKLLEDGLPVFEIAELSFVNADALFRLDPTIQRVEAVRGGTASIFASNAPGAIINHITRKGTDDFEGEGSLTWGNYDHFRFEGYASGPISDDVSFMVGGFFRTDDGVRDPGFTANRGGQIRASVNYEFEGGNVEVYGKYFNEQNIFYLPIPLTDTNGDAFGGVEPLEGFDANFDTLTSNDARLVTLLRPGGELVREDLQDGIHPEYFSIGAAANYEFNGILVSNNMKYFNGDVLFNAIFSLSDPVPSSFALGFNTGTGAFDASLGGDFADAVAAFGPSVDSLCVVEANSAPDPGAAGCAQFGTPVPFLTNNGNGLLVESGWWTTFTTLENFQNDLQANYIFDFFGEHSFTAGFYASDVNVTQFWNFNSVLLEVDGQPDLIEVLAVDETFNLVGGVTQNGFTQYGSFFRDNAASTRILALYFSDEWDITPELRLDASVRYQNTEITGSVEQLGSFDLSDQNPLTSVGRGALENAPDGGLPTLADDGATFGNGIFTPYSASFNTTNWSVGANYVFSDALSLFARVGDARRTPDLDDFADTAGAGIPVQEVFQVEGGARVDTRFFRAFITGFYTEFENQPFNDPVTVDGVTAPLNALIGTETLGLEVEGIVGPFYGFEVQASATIQNPDITDFTFLPGSPFFGIGADLGEADDPASVAILNVPDNQVPRIPELILNIQPSYSFAFGEVSGTLFGQILRIGQRFTDFTNENDLPGYNQVDAGFFLYWRNFIFQFNGNNLTNSIGLTEGNPRTDQIVLPGGEVSNIFQARPILGRNFRLGLTYQF